MKSIKQVIETGKTSIGIELGSTRIKAVMIDNHGDILESGSYSWENQLIDGIWTYEQSTIWLGLQQAYQSLSRNIKQKYGVNITTTQSIGISAMMHGYLVFDSQNRQLVPFRTWRNNITSVAANHLTALFNYNIPQRWSIAHLYQSILNNEEHVKDIAYLTTLAGYVHWQLTGEKVLGIGDASGMFPIDSNTKNYYSSMIDDFDKQNNKHYRGSIRQLLPKVLVAGDIGGVLTEQGAKLLDPSGYLQSGIKLCPPEGDAGTGMIATNSIKETTGNISAGTSVFAMVVLDKALSKIYEELDMVTTPAGKAVAMAHANNCTTDINAWIKLFGECLSSFNVDIEPDELFERLFNKSLEADADCGGLLSYGFYSGEHSVGLSSGCPTFLHPTKSDFTLANFIGCHIYSAFGAMKLGMDILTQQEKIKITQILAHGGIFKTKNVASTILAAALDVPVAVMDTASDGGAWGIALLANYLETANQQSLEQYLDEVIFKSTPINISMPESKMVEGYDKFINRYKKGIEIAKIAAKVDLIEQK